MNLLHSLHIFNDDVLFGENWNNQDIDVKTKDYYNSHSTYRFRND